MKKQSRRNFLKMAGSAGLFAFTGCSFPAIVTRRNPNGMLNHAAIGVGGMGGCDLEELMSHKRLQIVALCDVDANNLAKAAKLCPGARLYRNALEMFAAEGNRIDSVNVSTPDHTHFRYMSEALRRGINVYGQKPLCRTVEDCRTLERLAAETGAITQMGTQIAAHDCDRQTVEMLRSGAIGEVKHVWIFSNRGGQSRADHTWPLKPDPIPATLDWKEWLGDAPYRDYVKDVYHPFAWRRWRDFGTYWLGDLGLHLMSPVWMGLDLGKTSPTDVRAEYTVEAPEIMRQYWPRNSHIVYSMPGVKASGGKPFEIEWCDGSIVDRDAGRKDNDAFSSAKVAGEGVPASMDPKYFPPKFFEELFAKTSIKEQPLQGRVVQGTEGYLLSVHFDVAPAIVLNNGKVIEAPKLGPVPSHWHEYVNCCFDGKTPTSSFAWAGHLSEMVIRGNEAMKIVGA